MADREPPRLGRGLDSLISHISQRVQQEPEASSEAGTLQEVPLDQLSENPHQPRSEWSLEALNELTESLRRHGLLQPLVVRPKGEGFELIAGERRLRAARELGWEKVRCVVMNLEEGQRLEWALIENIQRADLGPLELARAYRGLIEQDGLTQDELARRLGKSRSAVANTLRLLELPENIKSHVSRGTVTMGAARALLAIEDPEQQAELTERIAEGGMTVRQVEDWASRQKKEPREGRTGPRAGKDPSLSELETQLTQVLGTRVQLRGTRKKGELRLAYFSEPQLDLLVRKLGDRAVGEDDAGAIAEGEWAD